MWTGPAIVAWLIGLGIGPGGRVDVELVAVAEPGFAMPEMPDRVAIVAPAGGAGLFMEGVLDRPEFELFIRGPQGDPDAAAVLALTADGLILAAPTSVTLPDGTHLVAVQRTGGRPAPVDRGIDGDRGTYAATYATDIA